MSEFESGPQQNAERPVASEAASASRTKADYDLQHRARDLRLAKMEKPIEQEATIKALLDALSAEDQDVRSHSIGGITQIAQQKGILPKDAEQCNQVLQKMYDTVRQAGTNSTSKDTLVQALCEITDQYDLSKELNTEQQQFAEALMAVLEEDDDTDIDAEGLAQLLEEHGIDTSSVDLSDLIEQLYGSGLGSDASDTGDYGTSGGSGAGLGDAHMSTMTTPQGGAHTSIFNVMGGTAHESPNALGGAAHVSEMSALGGTAHVATPLKPKPRDAQRRPEQTRKAA